MTWQSPTQEPEPLDALLREAVRTQVFPGEPGPFAFAALPDGQGRSAALPDGTPVRVSLAVAPATQTRHGLRACAGIRVTGAMVVNGIGHRIAADVAVDLATRAVLACEVRSEPVGRIAATM